MWPSLVQTAKEGGCNAIESYVFWNGHEPSPGKYYFGGRYNIVKFIKIVQQAGMHMILQIGPFVAAEWNYGGVPVWLHYVPGTVFRADNELWKHYMESFTTYIVNLLKKEKLFAPQGGPIILSQVENEYGVDFNLSPTNNELHSFDLNIIPGISEDNDSEYGGLRNEGASVFAAEEPNPESEDLDVNVEEDHDTEDPFVGEEGQNENGGNPNQFNGDQGSTSKKNCTNRQRWEVYIALLGRSVRGKLGKTAIKEVATLHSMHIRTVQRIWKRAKDTPPGAMVDVSQRRKNRCGRKRMQIDLQRVLDTPLHKRTTLRTMAEAIGISHSTLYKNVKEGLMRRHSNALKPHLKEENKVARLRFCMTMLDPASLSHEPQFIDMYNIVHIDEKWFYMTKRTENYYLLPEEDDPLRTCQSKNFIGKVMVLVAMARPRFNAEGVETFSGKIGVFPFVTVQPAQRRSRNREAGTLEIKPVTSVKREHVRKMLLEDVIPKIREKWPLEDDGKIIYIQQDNARTHVAPTDTDFQEQASQNGFDIRLMCQPPNSPDMNVLDLGFFSAIQALQHKVCPKSIEQLIDAVKTAFEEYPARKINHIFLTLQLCMQETMRIGGSNNYKIPHIKKEALEREGLLPRQIKCDLTIKEEEEKKREKMAKTLFRLLESPS
ncbi:unnamed protein product [Arabidopsis arenosa]|uniref:Beta-galactosidase n=1 Tax=Arabidopsis arenosa TaxID=38785 RepID=A0A8S1ZGB1_ARAAE|nr:unnamed protein product [Arabidopsis arenosa]